MTKKTHNTGLIKEVLLIAIGVLLLVIFKPDLPKLWNQIRDTVFTPENQAAVGKTLTNIGQAITTNISTSTQTTAPAPATSTTATTTQ